MTAGSRASAILPDQTDIPPRLAHAHTDLGAIVRNWNLISAAAGAAKAAAVVKADAYGCGARDVTGALYAAGCRTFFTAALGEAAALKRAAPEARIYVLNGPNPDDAGMYRAIGVSPVLNSLSQIGVWTGAGCPMPAAVHIDTGMNRLGLPPDQAGLAAAALAGEPVDLVLSHLANASAPHDPLNKAQAELFARVSRSCFPHAKASLAATAGLACGTDFQFDLVRPGVGLYGDNGLDEGDGRAMGAGQLEAALTVTAPILQIRDIPVGEAVGYGSIYRAASHRRAATLAIGYADGYLRAGSGRGFGVLDGVQCPILGRVSMDLISIDVTDAGAAAREGAQVQLLGPEARLRAVASALQTLPYEVLTNLGPKLRRASPGVRA